MAVFQLNPVTHCYLLLFHCFLHYGTFHQLRKNKKIWYNLNKPPYQTQSVNFLIIPVNNFLDELWYIKITQFPITIFTLEYNMASFLKNCSDSTILLLYYMVCQYFTRKFALVSLKCILARKWLVIYFFQRKKKCKL